MEKVWIVGAGGFVGSVLRYAMGLWLERLWPATSLPIGTLSVNILGCFLIGFLGAGAELRNLFNPELRAFLFIGALGGFTTFSAFAQETLTLGRDGQPQWATANVVMSIALCLLAVWVGGALGRGLWRV